MSFTRQSEHLHSARWQTYRGIGGVWEDNIMQKKSGCFKTYCFSFCMHCTSQVGDIQKAGNASGRVRALVCRTVLSHFIHLPWCDFVNSRNPFLSWKQSPPSWACRWSSLRQQLLRSFLPNSVREEWSQWERGTGMITVFGSQWPSVVTQVGASKNPFFFFPLSNVG